MTSEPQLHVVIGAGPLGAATAHALLQRDRRVRMLSRSGRGSVPEGAELRAVDVYEQAALRAQLAGATAVYQCAAPAYQDWVKHFMPFQRAIVAGLTENGPKLIVAENLYMYGAVDGPIHRDRPYAAKTRKGQVRAAAARELEQAHARGEIRYAAARGSDFFGPGVRNSMLGERVFAAALAGKTAQAVGNIDLPHSYTYIADFGEALARLGEREEALGRAWHVPNAAARSTRAIIEDIFGLLEQPARISSMGRMMMRIGGLFIPTARESVEMMYQFERPFIVDSRAYIATFGDHSTPLNEALAATLAWYRNQGVQAATV
jgi:nucleoside-diphosphate-sugar epimerase